MGTVRLTRCARCKELTVADRLVQADESFSCAGDLICIGCESALIVEALADFCGDVDMPHEVSL